MTIDPGLLLALAVMVPIIVGLVAYLAKALDGTSALAGATMGYMIILTQGFEWFLVFMTFFIAGTVTTSYRYHEKTEYGVSQKKRRVENVLGNGLMALFFAFASYVWALPFALYGFFAALAVATADTMSSEIGVLSPRKPVSVLDFRTPVRRGVNGGVSNIGNTFMFFGAALIGYVGMALFQDWQIFWITMWGGVFGCMVDSVLGATLENKGLIGNSAVNFIATLSGSALAITLAWWTTTLV